MPSVSVVTHSSWNLLAGVSAVLTSSWNVGQPVQQNLANLADVQWISTYPS